MILLLIATNTGYYTRMIHGGQDLPKEDSKPGSLMGSRKGSTTSSVGTDTESQLPSSSTFEYVYFSILLLLELKSTKC